MNTTLAYQMHDALFEENTPHALFLGKPVKIPLSFTRFGRL